MSTPFQSIEEKTSLSKSFLWEIERNAHLHFGPRAWTEEGVPFYITSNPFICKQYAQVIFGYLKDCPKKNDGSPLYILELGGGLGRFAYLFLKSLCSFLDELSLSAMKICYVLTDMVPQNLEFWKRHPLLKHYHACGLLEFALFDPVRGTPIIFDSGKELSEKPLIVIANYFFDSIPQDVFQIKNGQLFEGRAVLTCPEKSDPADPEVIRNLSIDYHWHPTSSKNIPELAAILDSYLNLSQDMQFLIPTAGIKCIDHLLKLSKGNLLLLTGDKGVGTLDEVLNGTKIYPVYQGTFTFQVNYHALSLYYAKQYNYSLFPKDPSPFFMVALMSFGGMKELPHEAVHSYHNALDHFTPCNYWDFINHLSVECPHPSLDQLLNIFKLSNWDPGVLSTFLKPLHALAAAADQNQKKRLEKALDAIWDNYYPTSQNESEFIRSIGLVFFQMNFKSKGLLYFQRAKEMPLTLS